MRVGSKRGALLGVLLLLAVALAACASDGAASAQLGPAGSPLAKIDRGMNEVDVREVLGEPDSSRSYQTWKGWNPFYYGSDTARTDWVYDSRGRVVFARNRYSGRLSVIHVVHDPSQGH
ncbi:MAG: hypothetical protein JRH16_18050 [Deltaproteobacteria bacterium]|nr:hypothetical protein [Deltaproteobacteria bacterium]MBW2361177.1 hypothetical protein [Deltaproteobacteria bacterium]